MKIASKSNVRRLSAGARSYRALLSTATVGFAFVFVASAVALLAGYLPNVLTAPLGQIDTGVVLLFAPLCALALGMVAEVVRSAFTQPEINR